MQIESELDFIERDWTNFHCLMEEAIDEYFPVFHYNKKRYGYYFLNIKEYVFQHEGKKMLSVLIKNLIML